MPELNAAVLDSRQSWPFPSMASKQRVRYDVLIVGAGVVGCAAAKAFAHHGRQVLVLERNLAEPDRIVGELLQPGGVAALKDLGLEDCLRGIDATPVIGYHMFWRDDQEVSFWFCAPPPTPCRNGEQQGPPGGKPSGTSFHHGRFVKKLRQRIAGEGNIILAEGNVIEILRDGDSGAAIGVKCRDEQLSEVRTFQARNTLSPDTGAFIDSLLQYYGDHVILADGGSSNFRSQLLPYRPEAQSRFWGLELIGVDLPSKSYAHAVIGRGPPVLIYQISKRETRILIDVLDDTYGLLGGNHEAMRMHIMEHVLPTLPSFLQPSLADALRGGSRLRSMPNAWVPASRNQVLGVAVLGDALNMRHPLTGAGMTIGLKDAALLAELLAPANVPSLQDSGLVTEQLKTFHWRRKRYAASLNILAHALYRLFLADSESWPPPLSKHYWLAGIQVTRYELCRKGS